ncbi:hypothetical protein FKM82_024238 [Ascaphus truei]
MAPRTLHHYPTSSPPPWKSASLPPLSLCFTRKRRPMSPVSNPSFKHRLFPCNYACHRVSATNPGWDTDYINGFCLYVICYLLAL